MEQVNTIKRVKSNLAGFLNSYERLPHNEMKSVQRELRERLGWSSSGFAYKKRGDTPIWEHEVAVLHEVFSRYNISIIN